MVDEGRVVRLLRAIADRTERLAGASMTAPADRAPLWLDAVKYLFVTTIEGCIDVAQHIAAAEGFTAPDSNAAALRLLGTHGVIDPGLAEALARAVGFRNVLVHQYAEVDDDRVVDALGRLDDFRDFVSQVSAWLVRARGAGDQSL